MLVGASVFCILVLLVLLADRAGSRFWQGGEFSAYYRCDDCDLRYPRHELPDPRLQVCPAGHTVVMEQRRTTAGVVGICACLGFLSVALLLIATGVVR
jgi:hypothetical protein